MVTANINKLFVFFITDSKTSVMTNKTYIVRCNNFVNVHVTDCHVKIAILTQYGRVSSSVIHLAGIYPTCNLLTIKIPHYLSGSFFSDFKMCVYSN